MRARRHPPRRGAVLPLTALLSIPLFGMLGFTIDVAHMVSSQTELQSVADAAALSGADQLMNGWVQYYLPGQTTQTNILSTSESNAKTYARRYADKGTAGGVTNLTILDGDFEFGYTTSSGYQSLANSPGFPNTIKLTIRRDSTANTPLALFFGSLFGKANTNLSATAAATIYTGTVNNLQSSFSGIIKILPMTFDRAHWNSFLTNGKGPDGTTDTSANGAPQLEVYPSIKFTGNFGELSLDQGNDGASTISGWIDNGVSSSDLANEFSANLLPLSSHAANTWDWKGNPGLKMSTVHTAANHVSETYLLPLFQAYDGSSSNYAAGIGNGSHYHYDIVQFVGITITQVDSGIHVQPAAWLDPNEILNSIGMATRPPSGSSSLITTFAPPKLSK